MSELARLAALQGLPDRLARLRRRLATVNELIRALEAYVDARRLKQVVRS